MDLTEIRETGLDPRWKGFPPNAPAVALKDIGQQHWSVLDGSLPMPVAVLQEEALGNNSRWMRAFLDQFQARLAPHGKTTMAPQLFARQLADGAWAITVATVQQFEVCRRFGVPRILIANQVVGTPEIDAILRALVPADGPEVFVLADSVEGARELGEACGRYDLSRPLNVLVEGGYPGGRTGARTVEGAVEVARAVSGYAPHLRLSGIEGYEGNIAAATLAETEGRVERFLDFLVEVAEACDEQALFPGDRIILSAGGSGFFDLVASRFAAARLSRPVEMVVRSGCYLTHDSHHFEGLFQAVLRRTPQARQVPGKLRAAIEVWARIQSTPEPGLAIATVGKRDISYDIELPVPVKWYRAGTHEAPRALGADYRVSALNDQHAYVQGPPNQPLKYGDLICLGISHPCTTFDKWAVMPVVDEDYRVIDAVRTFF